MVRKQIAIAASGDDYERYRYSTTDGGGYPPGTAGGTGTGTYLRPRKSYFSGATGPNSSYWYTQCCFVRFNTADLIPRDAIIRGVKLRMVLSSAGMADTGRNLNFEWYDWVGTPTDSDFAETVGVTAGQVPLDGYQILYLGGNGPNNIVMDFDMANGDFWVNRTGYTGIRFGIDGDQPTGENVIYFFAYDDTTYPEPQLLIDYELTLDHQFDAAPDGQDITPGISGGVSRYYDTVMADASSYWPLGEPSGFALDETFASDGTVTGGTRRVQGLVKNDQGDGAYYTTRASGGVDFGNIYNFSGTNSFTIEVWHKPHVVDASGSVVYAKSSDSPNYDGYYLEYWNGGVHFLRYDSTSHTADTCLYSTAPVVDRTYHWVVTYDGSTIRLYQNGRLVATQASTKSMGSPTASLKLNQWSSGGSACDGTSDSFAIYNGMVLTADEIWEHYRQGVDHDSDPPDEVLYDVSAPTYSNTHTFDGHNAMIITGASGHYRYVRWNRLNGLLRLYARVYVWVPSGTLDDNIALCEFDDTSVSPACFLFIDTAGKPRIANSSQTTFTGAGSVAITRGQWVRIEAEIFPSTTNGIVTLRLYNDPNAPVDSFDEEITADIGNCGASIGNAGIGQCTTAFPSGGISVWVARFTLSTEGWIGPLQKDFALTPLLDTFNRGDGVIGGSTMSTSQDVWRLLQGDGSQATTMTITSNQLESNGSGDAWTTDSYGPDCEVWATVVNLPGTGDYSQLFLRGTNVNSSDVAGYSLYLGDDGTLQIRCTNPFNIIDATGAGVVASGDRVGFRAEGDVLTAWVDDGSGCKCVLRTTDATLSQAGPLGVSMDDTHGAHYWEDFGGGTINAFPLSQDFGITGADSFDRADSTDMGNNWATVSKGSFQNTGFKIASNTATPEFYDSDEAEIWDAFKVSDDQYAQAKVTISGTATDAGPGLIVRGNGDGTMYRLCVSKAGSNNVSLSKFLATSTWYLIGRLTTTWNDGDVLRLEVVGNRLRVYQNGVQLGSDYIDDSIKSGQPGIASSSTYTSGYVDDFECGAVAARDYFTGPEQDPITDYWTTPATAGGAQLYRSAGRMGGRGEAAYYDVFQFGPDAEAAITIPLVASITERPIIMSALLQGAGGADVTQSAYNFIIKRSATLGWQYGISRNNDGSATYLWVDEPLYYSVESGDSFGGRVQGNVLSFYFKKKGWSDWVLIHTYDDSTAPAPTTQIAVSNKTSGNTASSGQVGTTASFSVAKDDLILLAVNEYVSSGSANAPAPAITDSFGIGLEWSLVSSLDIDTSGTDRSTLYLFQARATSAATGTVTITFDGGYPVSRICWVVDVAAYTTAMQGGSGRVQVVNGTPGTTESSASVNLATFSGSDNVAYGAFGVEETGAVTFAGAGGFSVLGQANGAGSGFSVGVATVTHTAGDNDPQVSWSGGTPYFHNGGIGVELQVVGRRIESAGYVSVYNEWHDIWVDDFWAATIASEVAAALGLPPIGIWTFISRGDG
jgi:hypothetical protein